MRIIEFYRVLARALAEFAQHGYDSKARLDYWLGELRMAANKSLPGMEETRRTLKQVLGKRFRNATSKTAFKRHHPDLTQYTIQRVGPKLAPILERRILAGVDLIRLNREQSIEKVLQRFSGLVTSIPEGGSRAIEVGGAKKHIGKSLRQMRFDERRVVIDQGHKLTSAIQRTIAEEGNAIAAVWHSHWRQPGYDYREDHKERDERVYAIRDNWAIRDGLMKVGPDGYTDEITQPGEEVFCRCSYVYVSNIRRLPDNMLTEKGRQRVHPAA